MRRQPSNRGFSLVEVVIALAVVGLTFIGLIGLLGVGVVSDQTSTQQTEATNIAASILADLRSTPNSSASGNSVRFNIPLQTATDRSTSTTPLAISGLTASYFYFDVSPAALNTTPLTSIPATAPAGAAFLTTVYVVKVANLPVPTYMVRCLVTWPAQTTTTPAGNVDIITEFVSH